MIMGIGIDITELERWHDNKVSRKVFTHSELQWCKGEPDKYAIIWSIKEAVVKALGTGFRNNITWRDIEVINYQNNYLVKLSENVMNTFKINYNRDVFWVNVTKTNDMVLAQVIWERY
ncbi:MULTISPECIES: holo-ACP synthase [Anoxybacillaceae]|uniref:Holo-[acyl-carrier protein] synthase n=2 Tax=Anoxybacillaceae TaxID=3120669 RepID=A0A4R1Q5J6_9BACL|nr:MULTISPECIES: holo-ACP synthase [Bacillaceae]ACJ32544.1 Holo-acyl carrier protein synthase:Phosphopantethiene-protein transferase [Anoxybacillus flavithermus WK1]TCL43135.1 holo-[acyl-carrier protein] synthase [Thermolongibacillus altinsuensis]